MLPVVREFTARAVSINRAAHIPRQLPRLTPRDGIRDGRARRATVNKLNDSVD